MHLNVDGRLQGVGVIPRHPVWRVMYQFGSMLQKRSQILEGGGAAKLASVNQRHEQVAHVGTALRSIEHGIFPMQDDIRAS